MPSTYVLVTFVPPDHREKVLNALFAAGAGKIGAYDRCAFVSRGTGRFRPVAGADPFSGTVGEDSFEEEERIELVVEEEVVEAAVAVLRDAHPYEEPALYLWALDPRCMKKPAAPLGHRRQPYRPVDTNSIH
ncbi:MAG: NGG1p interacting factor NIF3 [Rectinema sp.]|nr:NGG1p interacting factor NIF3 [Rectinema sp.]